MENQAEKNTESETESLDPSKGVCRDYPLL